MRLIKISDETERADGIRYISAALKNVISETGGAISEKYNGDRAELKIKIPERFADYIRSEAEDKIADVVAVGYKYDYFKKDIPASGLKDFEREILYSALIAADIDEDKRYIVKRTRIFDEYVIDGIFNFRLVPLRHKWEEITGYIPLVFTDKQLREFVRYLVGEKRSKKAIVQGGRVYDGNYNLLERSKLLPALPERSEGNILREVILSASGRVEIGSEIPDTDKKYLRDFYGGRIFFRGEL